MRRADTVAGVEHERMRELVASAPVARLATLTPGLRPHLVPVTFALVDEIVYTAVDHKPKRTRELVRIRNVVAHPDVTLLADHYEDDWSTLWWVRLDGSARLLRVGDEHQAAIAALEEKYEQYREHRPEGPVIAVDVTRWQGWSAN